MTGFSVRDHYLGTIPGDRWGFRSRLRVTVSVALQWREREQQTVTHESVPGVREFTLTCSVWNASRTDFLMTGTTTEPLEELITDGKPARGVTTVTLRDLVALGRYHLNSMRAGCIHQERNAGAGSPPCPGTGYRWGDAWLAEPLPEWLTPDYLAALLGQ